MECIYCMDDYLKVNIVKLDKNDLEGKIGFYVDEWGIWYDLEFGCEFGFLY